MVSANHGTENGSMKDPTVGILDPSANVIRFMHRYLNFLAALTDMTTPSSYVKSVFINTTNKFMPGSDLYLSFVLSFPNSRDIIGSN
jgi:hypothetical protein